MIQMTDKFCIIIIKFLFIITTCVSSLAELHCDHKNPAATRRVVRQRGFLGWCDSKGSPSLEVHIRQKASSLRRAFGQGPGFCPQGGLFFYISKNKNLLSSFRLNKLSFMSYKSEHTFIENV